LSDVEGIPIIAYLLSEISTILFNLKQKETGKRLCYNFVRDPAAFESSDAEKLVTFREIRDRIERRILAWLEEQGIPV
jgi:hypothetical protein